MEEIIKQLKENEEFIKEYDNYYLIKVNCPDNKAYKTTIDKWKPTSNEKKLKYEIDKRLDRKIYCIN